MDRRNRALISPLQMWRQREAELPQHETLGEVRDAFRGLRAPRTGTSLANGCPRCNCRMVTSVRVRHGGRILKVHEECVDPGDEVLGYDGGAA